MAESVIYPTASLATSVIAGLGASWAANTLAGDGQRTNFNGVVIRNLVWAVLPAAASPLIASSVDRTVWLVAIMMLYICFTPASSPSVIGSPRVRLVTRSN